MKRKRIKKYQGGGFTPGSGFAGTNAGKGIGMFGGLAGGLIEGADMKDGRMSTGGALGSGALKGASMGMALGPLGALIGAGVGMAGGLMKRDQVNAADDARLKAERDEERLRANMENQMKHQQMNQVLDQFPVKGNNTPRFDMGGPTGGGFDTNRMMVPTYAQGAGADAMPSFDFYNDGQQVSAQDYIAGLPQGQSINDHSQYWTSTLQPRFDQATQTWSNTGQGPMAQSAYGAMQKHALGGSTMGPGYEVEGGEMMQTGGETPMTYGQGGMSKVASQEFEVQGPKHSNGGVQANDNQGARVYSDKLRVDDALLSKLSKL